MALRQPAEQIREKFRQKALKSRLLRSEFTERVFRVSRRTRFPVQENRHRSIGEPITVKQKAAIVLYAQGVRTHDIARRLRISQPAVYSRLHKAQEILEVRTLPELIQLAKTKGWV